MNWEKAFQLFETAIVSDNRSLRIQALVKLANASNSIPEIILEHAVRILVELLRSPYDNQDPSIQEVSAYCLKRIACLGNGRLAVVIGECGAISCLLSLTQVLEGSGKLVVLKCLRNIVTFGANNRVILFRNGGVQSILDMLYAGDHNVRRTLLEILSALALVREARVVIFNTGGACFLVESARFGSLISRTRAAQAIGLLGIIVRTRRLLIREGAVQALVELLQSGNEAAKLVAANALGVIASHLDYIRRVSEAGAVPLIAGMLGECEGVGLDIAVDVLCILAVLDENAAVIFEHLDRILKGDSAEAKGAAVDLIWSLAGFKHVESALQNSGVIPALVDLLKDGDDVIREKVAGAFAQLSYSRAARLFLAHSGAIPLLITILQGETVELRDNAAEALVNFAEDPLFSDRVSCVLDDPCFLNMQDRLVQIRTSEERLESSVANLRLTQDPFFF